MSEIPNEDELKNAAEEFLRTQPEHIEHMPASEDLRILQQIDKTARLVAEHEMAVTTRVDEMIWDAARLRRAAEADLNRLLTKRVNDLAAKWKEVL